MCQAVRTWMRLVAMALALACQISAGAAVPMQDGAAAQARLVTSVAVFCQSGVHRQHDGVPVHRQVPDHALAQALFAHANVVALLDGAAPVPTRRAAGVVRFGLPGVRAPPPRTVYASQPRGPPVSV